MAMTDEVCRDFEKGDCRRGDRCKYSHSKLQVCRDFQKKKCEREKCRYLHVTHEEEESYENSGKLPDHISEEEAKKNRVMNTPYGRVDQDFGAMYGKRRLDDNFRVGQDFGAMYGKRRLDDNFNMMAALSSIPKFGPENEISGDQLCRDFEKGNCSRGNRCKYYHPKLKICRDFQNKKCERESCRFLHITREEEESYENTGTLPDHIDEGEAKKMKVMNGSSGRHSEDINGRFAKRRRDDDFSMMTGLSALPQALIQENELLKLKITELQRHIMDLHKMNDTLYQQNNSYRQHSRIGTGGI